MGVSYYRTLSTFLGPPFLDTPTTSLYIILHHYITSKTNFLEHRASYVSHIVGILQEGKVNYATWYEWVVYRQEMSNGQ
jgi:hypothetical protein